MQFLFNDEVGKPTLKIKGEEYKYLFKVRRHNVDDTLYFRSTQRPEALYHYKVMDIDGRTASLELLTSEDKAVASTKKLHIAWCVIDPKSVEKVLPSLNEIGVAKISFIYCDRSQKNFKVDLKRYERILHNSSQQCGRSDTMVFETYKNLDTFISEYPDTVMLDFCEQTLGCDEIIDTVLIGCEGGFSESEREKLQGLKRFRLDTPMILRSESAAMAIASKVLI